MASKCSDSGAGRVRVGVGGWNYAPWRGVFYPNGLKQADELAYPARETSFGEFLKSNVGVGSGTLPGREVLIQIALIPVALALAATLIGLAWLIFG